MPPRFNIYCRCVHGVVTSRDRYFISVRSMSAATHRWSTPDENFLSFQWWRKKFLTVQHLYDEVTGLKEVHDAQSRVIDAEKNFVLAQEERRKIQSQLSALQKKLKQIYGELDKTPRGEERYVQLVTLVLWEDQYKFG
ncbi:uncharacterized protein LOC124171903 isoform X2 [Ischnura elegans]|uniref:uncharacterized protein LOC124171903 isoform X2 n=1 Tax=Ischnura elegans TaxID=197161 RepID=UPI001ED8BA83|nr:uncharacterized protein LOC124171903 isoform X2 [Ischnura elegans]